MFVPLLSSCVSEIPLGDLTLLVRARTNAVENEVEEGESDHVLQIAGSALE